jgi:hypothetical protein
MVLLKLGLLSCAFYVGVTVLLGAALCAVIYFRGLAVFVDGRNAGLRFGIAYGAVFGVIWLVSFAAAWWIVWSGIKSNFPTVGN